MALDLILGRAVPLGIFVLLVRLVVGYFSSPLKQFPGPFWAKFTDWWRLYDYWNHTQIKSHQRLHEDLGAAVRIGPNMISLSDPAMLKTVYSIRGEYAKSSFYEIGDAINNGLRIENVFSTRNNAFHNKYMKPYQKYFTSTAILSKEHLSNKVAVSLCQELEARFINGANAGKTADLADWIEFAAWDLDWEMTFSQEMGFLKAGKDVKGLVRTGENIMRYLGIVGQMPYLDRLLGKNKYCPIKFDTFEHAANYSVQQLIERQSNPDTKAKDDFLANFLEAKEQHPDTVTDNEVISYVMMNVLAGADTTALELKAIVYNILSHPSVYAKLRAELDAASLSFPPRHEQTRDLPYLTAVIKEGMRMHPVIGGILERVVPEDGGGLALPDGRVIAPGTKVGINPWVSTRNTAVFGEDACVFRPERWLQAEHEDEETYLARLKVMKESDFTFGYGKRQCVGRHLAMLEILKVTSTLFSRYDISLDPSAKQWSPRWWWFSFVDDINVKLQRRAGVADLPRPEKQG